MSDQARVKAQRSVFESDSRDALSGDERYFTESVRRESKGFERRLLEIIDRLAPKSLQCVMWYGSGGICETYGVGAYLHPNVSTPESRGCKQFVMSGTTGRGFGDATWCNFCCLPMRDHKPTPVARGAE